MREMLNPTSAIAGYGLGSSVALFDHGRPLQRSIQRRIYRTCVTSAVGGPIALVEEGISSRSIFRN